MQPQFSPPDGSPPSFWQQAQRAMRPRPLQPYARPTQLQEAVSSAAQLQGAVPAAQPFVPAEVGANYQARQQPRLTTPAVAAVEVRGAAPAQAAAATTAGAGYGFNRYQPTPLIQPGLQLPTPPAPVTQPASGLDKVLQALRKGASSVGQTIKNDPLGTLNAGFGVAGAIEYATARAPQLPGKPEPYTPFIRPAQGLNPGALAAGRGQIQATQRQASKPTTSDSGTGTVQRLFAQAQAGQQQNELTLKDNEAFQADQRRVDEQQNGAYDANYKTQRSYQEKVFDLGQRAYEARRQQGAAMSQAALTYLTQSRADKLNSIERGKESAEALRLGITLPSVHTNAGVPGITGSVMRRKPGLVQDPEQVPSNAKGGKIKFNFGRGRSKDEMGHNQTAITLQAQRAFNDSVREASRKRSKGITR